MVDKVCSKCGIEKPAEDFWKLKRSGSGLQSSCIECMKAHRAENSDRILTYQSEYQKTEKGREVTAKAGAKYKRTDAGRSGNKRNSKKYQLNNPEKARAHAITGRAIKSGKLVRQPCEECGSTHRIEAHHDDYSNPLDVRWLCRRHHVDHHMKQKTLTNERI